MRAILEPVGAGLQKYPSLGADVLLAFNDALSPLNPSASMGVEGGNFPSNIVGGFHIHEGK